MFDEDSQVNEQFERCERCDCGGIYCDEESGDWLCDNCTHNYGHAEEDASSSEHIPLFKTEQGEEIERLKAELVEATEMALGQAKTLIEKDKQIDELKTESKILETTVQELRGTDWAAVNIESQKRIAELEARLSWNPELGPEEIKTLVNVALALGYSTPDSLEETCTGHGQRKLIMNIARGITGIIRRNEELGSRVTAHDLIEFCAIKQDEYRKKNNIIAAMEFCSIMAAIQEAVELRQGDKG